MTTLNTIIEEEVEAYKNDYAQAITDVGGFGLAKHIERFLTSAMQRAYEAGQREERAKIREEVEADMLNKILFIGNEVPDVFMTDARDKFIMLGTPNQLLSNLTPDKTKEI